VSSAQLNPRQQGILARHGLQPNKVSSAQLNPRQQVAGGWWLVAGG